MLAQLCSSKLVQPREYCVKHVRKLSQRGHYTLPSFSEHESVKVKQLPTLLAMEKIFQGNNPLSLSMCKPKNIFFRKRMNLTKQAKTC